MSLINVNKLTFAYEGSYDNIFENVSFQIDTDWKLGFTGRNGRGKTTFLNLLMGKFPYEGQISTNVEFAYFPFTISDPNIMSLDIIDQILPDYEYWKLSRELHYLETSDEILYRPFSTLSGGEQAKIQLAALFLKENSFLLIDEPTNHLDLHGREVLAAYLRKKKGFILVSHDRTFLDCCVDHILSINKTNIEIQKGNFSSWLHNKELQDRYEIAENEKLSRQIKSMETAARRTASWSDAIEKRKTKGTDGQAGVKPDKGHIGAQAAKMMKRSKAASSRRDAAVASKSKLLKNIEYAEDLKIHPLSYRADVLVRLDQITAFYGNSPDCPLFCEKSLTIRRGDRIALQGPNGCGKSSILKLIQNSAGEKDEGEFADLPSFTGNIHAGSDLIISYVPQSTAGLSGTLDAYAACQNIDITLFKTILRKLDFSRLQLEKAIEDYSQGQKKKVLLAASLAQKAHLYIWDEPLNYIDIFSRMQIENLLLEFQPSMIFVEHDKAFCNKVATDTIPL